MSEEIPKDNSLYKDKEYWNGRFSKEDSYDWLSSFDGYKDLLLKYLPSDLLIKILIVGCGNSDLSASLYDIGYTNITNIDYSEVVIEKMQRIYPKMTWICMDMKDMQFPGQFDVIIDKCAMDALLVTQRDPWNPEDEIRKEIDSYLSGVSKFCSTLYLQLSFGQPHFRKIFFCPEEHPDRFEWTFKWEVFGKGFGYHLFVLKKIR